MNTYITAIELLKRQAAGLLLYQNVFKNDIGAAFLNLLQALSKNDHDGLDCLQVYSIWFQAMAARNLSWQDYLINQILKADNPFSQQAQQTLWGDLPPALIAAAQQDLQALQAIYNCTSNQLSQWVQTAAQMSIAPVAWTQVNKLDAKFLQTQDNWGDGLKELVAYYRENGTGLFAQYRALRWQSGQLIGISYPDPIELKQLACYELQRQALIKNTEFLLSGYAALNVLLYGSRGSGKSSLVKGLLNEYASRQLRLIEVGKEQLKDLPIIMEKLRGLPQKFIIFVDDLSFEEDDDAFKALKVVLEGNITARPQNVVVYATSNRRHLVREFFNDRPRPSDADEVNAWDTVQEKLSFSDRFGLTLTFEAADQNTYLEIVSHLAAQANINLSQQELEFQALQWATRHNGRSGRTARQFIDFLKAEQMYSKQ